MKFPNINKCLFISVVASLCACIGLLGCSYSSDQKPILAVTIQPQKYLLEKIVGDKYNVLAMLTQGSNPEAYEPSMNHIMNLEKSQAYFCVGNLGFELAIKNRLVSNAPDLKIIDSSKGIELLKGTHEPNAVEHEHSHEVDPHVWTSVPNAMIMAKNMYDAVVELDPKHKKYYTKNYEALEQELTAFNDKLTQQLASIKGSSFAVWHPSLSYFARDYGLHQISMENEGKEVTADLLRAEIDKVAADSVKVMFYQMEFDSRQAEILNKDMGTRLVKINPLTYQWEEELQKIADALTGKE